MKIDIHPNFCKVDGTQEELRWLRDLLSFDVPGAKYTKLFQRKIWDGKKKMFNIVSKIFPIGLLGYVCSKGGDQKIDQIDHRVYPKFDTTMPVLNGMVLRGYQKDAVNKCFNYKNCLIQAATNSGKTVVFSGVIKKMYPIPTLILIHREEILWQIKEVVEELTGLEVGVITATKGVLIKPVTIAMIPTLLKRLGADQEITDFFDSVQCVIVDEVHHAKSASVQSILSSSKAVYRFGFSGTIQAEGTHDGMLIRSWIGSVEFEITNDELISMGVSARPRVLLHEMDIEPLLGGIFDEANAILEIVRVDKFNAVCVQYAKALEEGRDKVVATLRKQKEKLKKIDGKQLMRKVYDLTIQRGIIHNIDRNTKVLETIAENPGKSMLVVVDLLAHGKEILDLLAANDIDAEFISGASEVRKEALDRFKKGNLHVLISTNIIDEGVDISRIDILVMIAGKKSRRQLLQRVGRSLRKKKGKENTVLIVDFMDYGSRHLEKHSKERYNIYRTEKFDIEFIE